MAVLELGLSLITAVNPASADTQNKFDITPVLPQNAIVDIADSSTIDIFDPLNPVVTIFDAEAPASPFAERSAAPSFEPAVSPTPDPITGAVPCETPQPSTEPVRTEPPSTSLPPDIGIISGDKTLDDANINISIDAQVQEEPSTQPSTAPSFEPAVSPTPDPEAGNPDCLTPTPIELPSDREIINLIIGQIDTEIGDETLEISDDNKVTSGKIKKSLIKLWEDYGTELQNWTISYWPSDELNGSKLNQKELLKYIGYLEEGGPWVDKQLPLEHRVNDRMFMAADFIVNIISMYNWSNNPALKVELINIIDMVFDYGLTIDPKHKKAFKADFVSNIEATFDAWIR